MANFAFLKNSVVVIIAPTNNPPNGLDYDPPAIDAAGANVGDTWNGVAFVPRPVPAEQQNLTTLQEQAEGALATDRQIVSDVNAFLSGVGAGNANLTAAQQSAFARQIAPAVKALAQQNIGIIRLLLNQLDATD